MLDLQTVIDIVKHSQLNWIWYKRFLYKDLKVPEYDVGERDYRQPSIALLCQNIYVSGINNHGYLKIKEKKYWSFLTQ